MSLFLYLQIFIFLLFSSFFVFVPYYDTTSVSSVSLVYHSIISFLIFNTHNVCFTSAFGFLEVVFLSFLLSSIHSCLHLIFLPSSMTVVPSYGGGILLLLNKIAKLLSFLLVFMLNVFFQLLTFILF